MGNSEKLKRQDGMPERKQFRISQRERDCFELWVRGATYREISAILIKKAEDAGESTRGLSHEQCRRYVKKVWEAEDQDLTDEIAQFKVKAFRRLENLYTTYEKAGRGYIDPDLGIRIPNPKAGKLALDALKEQIELTGHKQAIKVANSDGSDVMAPLAEAFTQYEKMLLKVYGDEAVEGENDGPGRCNDIDSKDEAETA